MKKMKFTFQDGNEYIYDEDVFYEVDGDYIAFSIGQTTFRVLLQDNFRFLKFTESDNFELFHSNSETYCKYILNEENVTLSIKVLNLEYVSEDKKFIIKYNIESDEENIKKIIFSFD